MLWFVRIRSGIFDQHAAAVGTGKLPLAEQRLHIGDRIPVERPRLERDVHKRLDRFGGSDVVMRTEIVDRRAPERCTSRVLFCCQDSSAKVPRKNRQYSAVS